MSAQLSFCVLARKKHVCQRHLSDHSWDTLYELNMANVPNVCLRISRPFEVEQHLSFFQARTTPLLFFNTLPFNIVNLDMLKDTFSTFAMFTKCNVCYEWRHRDDAYLADIQVICIYLDVNFNKPLFSSFWFFGQQRVRDIYIYILTHESRCDYNRVRLSIFANLVGAALSLSTWLDVFCNCFIQTITSWWNCYIVCLCLCSVVLCFCGNNNM